MRYLFFSIISIVVANIGLGYLAKNFHPFSAIIPWFVFASLLSIFLVKNELLKKETYNEIIKAGIPAFNYFLLSATGPLLYFFAIKNAGLGITSVISNAKFGVLIVASFFLFKEKPTKNELLASLLLIPGIFLLIELKDFKYNNGVLLAGLSMVCYAGQNILNKVLNSRVPYKAIVCIRSIVITIVVTIYAVATGEIITVPLSYDFWIVVIIGAPCGIIISKYYDFKALESISFFTFSIWQPLKPVLIIACSILLFNEEFSTSKYIGCALLLTSSLIASIKKEA